MRFLYVVHRFWPYLGGSERYFLELARRAARCGNEVTVFTTDAWDYRHLFEPGHERIERLEESTDGVRVRRFRVRHPPARRLLSSWRRILAPNGAPPLPQPLLPGLWRHLLGGGRSFDLVHAGVFPFTSPMRAARLHCRRHGIPFVCQPMLNLGEPHAALDNPYYLGREQIALAAGADAVVVNTEHEAEVLNAKGIDRERITIASPAVVIEDVTGGDAAAFRRRRGAGGPIVLQLSTQTFDKGSLHTIEAMKNLWNRGSAASLVLIGQPMQDFLDHIAAQPPAVRSRIHVLGYVDEHEKKDALAACDVLVMPSRADSFGIAYLEAWANRKPVVGCHAGGVPRVIDEGRDGFLVPFGDVHMLSEYVEMLLADRELAARMGEAGFEKTRTCYTWEQTWATVDDLYQRLVRGRLTGSPAHPPTGAPA
jgi:glycosyltransferase involved in cell wall biosynthesis